MCAVQYEQEHRSKHKNMQEHYNMITNKEQEPIMFLQGI